MSNSSADWVKAASGQLAELRLGDSGWPYQPGKSISVEPTVLASLAQLSAGESRAAIIAQRAAGWLASIQAEDGGLGINSDLPVPAWSTPYGVLLWSAVGSHLKERARAVKFLLGREGRRLPRSSESGHNTTLAGWPWVLGTHSWLEPTALSILALVKEGQASHPRVEEAVRLVEDRALSSGGWNHGNTVVFGTELRAQPGPTGLALLALASVKARRSEAIERGSEYLIQSLPKIASPRALGWGILGLSAWRMELQSPSSLLAQCYSRIQTDPYPMDLALLILAAGNDATQFFI